MNVFGHHRGWETRRPVLQSGLRRLNPDVATFQAVFKTDGYVHRKPTWQSGVELERAPAPLNPRPAHRWDLLFARAESRSGRAEELADAAR
jgi:hypothetical protein